MFKLCVLSGPPLATETQSETRVPQTTNIGTRRAHRSLYPLVDRAGERPAEHMRHGNVPITLANPKISPARTRSSSSATLPAVSLRTSSPPPRHPHPPNPLHRPHRHNGHSAPARCHHPHREHRNARGASRRLSHPRHYTAPSVEHRNGAFVAGSGVGSGPPTSLDTPKLCPTSTTDSGLERWIIAARARAVLFTRLTATVHGFLTRSTTPSARKS